MKKVRIEVLWKHIHSFLDLGKNGERSILIHMKNEKLIH